MRRWVLVAVVGVAGAGLAVALVHVGGGSTTSRSATVAAVRFVFPDRFHRRYFSSCRYMVTGVHGGCVRGVVVASYPLRPNPEGGAAGASFRHGGVLLELYRAPWQGPNVIAPTIQPPVSLSAFHFAGMGERPSTEQRELFFSVRRVNYWAIAWVGSRAAKPDRDALASVVASIRID